MVGLADLSGAAETVEVRGQMVDVYGVSAKGAGHLLAKYPELRKLFSGVDVDTDVLMELGGDIVAAVIAAGTGSPGDHKTEEMACKLSISEQADLLEAVLRLTLPQGIGPFVARLEGLGGVLNVAAPSDSDPDTKSQTPSTD